MKRKICAALCVALCVMFCAPASAAEPPKNSARSAILMSASGDVLFESAADEPALIASTTKIMTALIALERCRTDETVTVPAAAVGAEGSSMYLKAGEKLTVYELLCGALVASGNDAALTLAYHVAGGVERFAELMNAKAAELGMSGTSFKNPHGLDEDGHRSTARDMAVLTAEAMKNEVFREIVSSKTVSAAGRSLKNHNKLLWDCEGAIGVKTGFTKAAGRALASCVSRGGLELICVTLGDPNDWEDHASLYDWAFEEFHLVTVAREGTEYCRVPVLSGVSDSVGVGAEEELRVLCRGDEELKVTIRLPEFVYAGAQAGDVAGSLEAESGGRTHSVRLLYTEAAEPDEGEKLTLWEKIKRAWYLGNAYGAPYRYYMW